MEREDQNGDDKNREPLRNGYRRKKRVYREEGECEAIHEEVHEGRKEWERRQLKQFEESKIVLKRGEKGEEVGS